MRILLLSDIHSNLEALEACLAAAPAHDVVVNLGDIVGYGASPNEVTVRVRNLGGIFVRGNHDKACTGIDDLEWFNPVARAAAVWTQENLTAENAAWTRELPEGPLHIGGFEILHGSPYDEDEYLLAADEAVQAFSYLEARLAFFGHTHVQGGFIWNQSRVETITRSDPRSDPRSSAWGYGRHCDRPDRCYLPCRSRRRNK